MSLIISTFNNDEFYDELIKYLKKLRIEKFDIIEYKDLIFIPYEEILAYFSIDNDSFKKTLIKKKEYVGYNGVYYINKYGCIKLINFINSKKDIKFEVTDIISELQDKLLMFMYNKEINKIINSYLDSVNIELETKNKKITSLEGELKIVCMENDSLEKELENIKTELDSAIEKNTSLLENLKILEESIKKKSKSGVEEAITEAKSNSIIGINGKKKQDKKIIHILRKKNREDFNIYHWIIKENVEAEFMELSKEYLLDELGDFPYDYIYYITILATEEKIKYLNFMLDINYYSADVIVKFIGLFP